MIFKSAYTKFLEAELVRVRAEHKEQLAELKSTHAEELACVKNVTEQLRDEVDRLRKYLFPGMLTAKETAVDNSQPSPPTTEDIGGTPFQRLARKVLEAEEKKAEDAEKVKAELRKRAAEAAISSAYKPAESGGQGQVPS